jgi:DNA-binding MarR family transcriptional regulator
VPSGSSGTARVAFLLAQLGSYVGERFERQVRELGLTPSEAGVLRLLARRPGLSQRELAHRLRAQPSRMVALIDGLESRGYVTRRRSDTDRRNYELHMTAAARPVMRQLRALAERNSDELLSELDETERTALADVLTRLSRTHGLDEDLHRDSAGRDRSPGRQQT